MGAWAAAWRQLLLLLVVEGRGGSGACRGGVGCMCVRSLCVPSWHHDLSSGVRLFLTNNDRPSPTRVYEISSSSDEEEEEKAMSALPVAPSMRRQRRSGSMGSVGDAPSTSGAASALAAASAAAPGATGTKQHIRPQMLKRPRISISSGGGGGGAFAAAAASSPSGPAAHANGGGGGGGEGEGGGCGPDVRALLRALYDAAGADAASIEQGWPPQEMARLTPRLSAVFAWDQRDQARLLNAGLLRVLKRLLAPPLRGAAARAGPGRYTPAHTKAAILKLLQVLPVGLAHLQEAKLGPVLLAAYGGCPEEEAQARTLVGNWARFVDTVQRNGIPPSRTRQHGQGWRSPSPASSSAAAAAGGAAYPRAPVGNGSNAAGGYVPVTNPAQLFAPRAGGGGRRASAPAAAGKSDFSLQQVFGGAGSGSSSGGGRHH